MQTAMERLKGDLGGALHNVRAELERVEILAAALYGFSKPIPTTSRRSNTSRRGS